LLRKIKRSTGGISVCYLELVHINYNNSEKETIWRGACLRSFQVNRKGDVQAWRHTGQALTLEPSLFQWEITLLQMSTTRKCLFQTSWTATLLSVVSFDDGTRGAEAKSHFWNEPFPLNFVGIGGIWFLDSSVHCN